MAHRLIYKCPTCGLRPSSSYYGITGLTMFYCCRLMGAKPTRDEAIEAWNTLAVSEIQRKLSISEPDSRWPSIRVPPD